MKAELILVTGGTGLTGSHLVYELLNRGKRVKVLVRTDKSKIRLLKTFEYYTTQSRAIDLYSQIQWATGDVTDQLSLEEAFENITHVYHTAAFVSFSSRNKRQIYTTNVEGTAQIVNLCLEKQIQKLCFVSSIAALGTSENGEPVCETDLWKPVKNISDYSLSKVKSEFEVWRGIAEGLNAVIVNPSVILGPGNWDQGSAQLVSTIGRGLSFYTNGGTGVVDVRDVANIMITLMDSDVVGERFVLSSTNISYLDLFSNIARNLSVKPPHRLATPAMLNIAWRLDALRACLLRAEPKLTKDSVAISQKVLQYSADKIIDKLNYRFLPIDETIKHVSRCFLADCSSK